MLSLLLAGRNVLAFITLLSAGPSPARMREGLGTVFGPAASDPVNSQDTLSCSYQLPPYRPRSVEAGEYAVALPGRRARCGARVVLCNRRSGRCAIATVLDRGPRRAYDGRDPWGIDMTPAVAAAIGLNGLEPVTWWIVGGVAR